MVKGFRHVDDTERRLARNMAKEGMLWVTIQKITGRSPDTIRSRLNPVRITVPKGVPSTCRHFGNLLCMGANFLAKFIACKPSSGTSLVYV